MSETNLQTDRIATDRYMAAFLPRLQKLGRQVRQMELSALGRRRGADPAGVTFQEERFEPWFRDAVPLFREHMVATGQDVEDYQKKNLPLLKLMDEAGVLQIMTARCNGRMAAYLMTVVGPSLDEQGVRAAENLPLFASADFPGLGLKLMRASLERLREKSVGPVLGRAGVLGDGPRLSIAYRRLGFEEFGQMHRLDLRAA